jgi:hypothetical protein
MQFSPQLSTFSVLTKITFNIIFLVYTSKFFQLLPIVQFKATSVFFGISYRNTPLFIPNFVLFLQGCPNKIPGLDNRILFLTIPEPRKFKMLTNSFLRKAHFLACRQPPCHCAVSPKCEERKAKSPVSLLM